MKTEAIKIPEPPNTAHKIYRNKGDVVTFKFKLDETNFYTDAPDAFDPPLPSGGFISGNKIGPYKPNKSITVNFFYDGSGVRGMHSISIGD
jgi:hypothetical protein